jgi:hypothetical protein
MHSDRECYVIRIYRRSEGPPAEPVGLVERVDDGRQTAFHGFEELKRALSRDGPQPRRERRSRTRKGKW